MGYISKSKMGCYDDCPRNYSYKYIFHFPVDTEPSSVTIIGIEAHQMLCDFFDIIDIKKIQKIKSFDYQYFISLMDEYFDSKNFENKKELEIYYQRFAKYIATNIEKYDLKESIPIHREKKIYSKKLNLMGIIDVIGYRKNGYYVLDYKSNENYVKKFELALYAMVVNDSDLLDDKIKWVGSYGYKTGMVKFWKVDNLIKKDEKRHWNDIIMERVEILNNLNKNDTYHPIQGNHCYWCGYQERCNDDGIEEYISGY